MVEDLQLLDYDDIKNKNINTLELLLCLNFILNSYDIDLFKKQVLFISIRDNKSLDVLMSEFNSFYCDYDLYYLETYLFDDNMVKINFDKECKYNCKRVYN